MTDIAQIIEEAKSNPPKPVIEGLLNECETVGLHGPPEVFKTFFCQEVAESLARGIGLFGVWPIPQRQSVYFFETEMSLAALGRRLEKRYADQTPPEGVHFAREARLHQFRRAGNLSAKFALLSRWVEEVRADVVILDTCNPFFRGRESSNDETSVGLFFDLLAMLPARTKLFVRHNHKPRLEDSCGDAATKIRGSGQFADVPDLLLELRRTDKRTNEATLSVSKFRHGTKPDDLDLWLDLQEYRLIAVPPVIYLLQSRPLCRLELLELLQGRFGISQRTADDMIGAQGTNLVQTMDGHKRLLQIDWEAASQADWFPRL